jgi:hypothetical protein
MLRASRQVKLGLSELVNSAIGSYCPAGFGCEVTANCLYLAMVKVPLDLPAFINAQRPMAVCIFWGFKSVRIIGERSR